MKKKLQNLVETYKGYLMLAETKGERYILSNVIEDLENIINTL